MAVRGEAATLGLVLFGVAWTLTIAAALASVWFYLAEDTFKAIYWLLVMVVLNRWTDGTMARLSNLERR